MTTANDDLKEAVNAALQDYFRQLAVQYAGAPGAPAAIMEGALWAWCSACWKARSPETTSPDAMADHMESLGRDYMRRIAAWDAERRGAPPPGVTIQ